MTALAELIAQHAPYLSKRSDNKLCLRCLDESVHGEFANVEDWAQHLAEELTAAGYRKASPTAAGYRKASPKPRAETEVLFP